MHGITNNLFIPYHRLGFRTMSTGEEKQESQPELRVGPDPKAVYPIKVQYCGNCSLPIEVNQTFRFSLLQKIDGLLQSGKVLEYPRILHVCIL